MLCEEGHVTRGARMAMGLGGARHAEGRSAKPVSISSTHAGYARALAISFASNWDL